MTQENSLGESLEKIVSGQTINEQAGDWRVSNLNSPFMIDLLYLKGKDSAVYGFSLGLETEEIQFWNYHREASHGTGTTSLKQLEAAFQYLSDLREKKVLIIFHPSKQVDTANWLERNNYALKDGIYVKELTPTMPKLSIS